MAWSEILYFATLAFSILLSIFTTILAYKRKKSRKVGTEDTENGTQTDNGNIEDKKVNTFWSDLFQKIPSYMVAAEKFYNQLVGKNSGIKTGVQKLEQVLDKVKIDCLTAGVEYNEQKATDMVNSLVDLTNQVNTNK